jgi:hypothetical protein
MPKDKQMILDILTLDDPPTFDVDLDLTEVQVSWPCAPHSNFGTFVNATGNPCFDLKDNVIIREFAWLLPYHFSISTGVPWVWFSWHDSGGGEFTIPEFNGPIFLPYCSQPIGMGLFCEGGAGLATSKYDIYVACGAINISMIGAPAVLDDAELEIQMMLKVEHTLPMVA